MTPTPLSSNLSMAIRSIVIAKPALFMANGTPKPSTISPRVAGATTSRLWILKAASRYLGPAATCR